MASFETHGTVRGNGVTYQIGHNPPRLVLNLAGHAPDTHDRRMFATRRPRLKAICLAAALLSAPAPLQAQSAATEAAPFEPQLMRLSEIFGALHFLRPLCGEQDQPSWREQMSRFLDAETIDENRRRRFIERFNQGYRGFSAVYRECTEAASLAMAQYLSEGEVIITDVTSRYGR